MAVRKLIGCLSAAIALAGCAGNASGGSSVDRVAPLSITGGRASLGQLVITRAYIPDPATPALAAAFFTVTNTGPADRLMSVSTSEFRSSVLNRYVTATDGAESMVPVGAGLTIPAHGRLVLHPGGDHVMLAHPRSPLRQGTTARLRLQFSRAGSVTMVVPVVADTGLPGSSGGDMSGMDMSGMNMSGGGG